MQPRSMAASAGAARRSRDVRPRCKYECAGNIAPRRASRRYEARRIGGLTSDPRRYPRALIGFPYSPYIARSRTRNARLAMPMACSNARGFVEPIAGAARRAAATSLLCTRAEHSTRLRDGCSCGSSLDGELDAASASVRATAQAAPSPRPTRRHVIGVDSARIECARRARNFFARNQHTERCLLG